MPNVPDNFYRSIRDVVASVTQISGFLSPREIEFLYLLAACPTAAGSILEIGCYHGKSTVVLAKGAELATGESVVTVDPLEFEGAVEQLHGNLTEHHVDKMVEFHRSTSEALGEDWTRPLRLLWIDGDHSYRLKKIDFDTFFPHLADGAVIAFHDVLNHFEGPVRVFMESVLLSDHFASAGLCGSIGWAQYRQDPAKCLASRRQRLRLYRRLSTLIPSVAFNQWPPKKMERTRHKLYRSLVPHGRVNPTRWLSQVA